MRHATIIAGAPFEEPAFYRDLVDRAEVLVAADSGAAVCRDAGRAPDILVGDLDSVSPDVLAWAEAHGSSVRRVPVAKDESDLALALDAARQAGCASVTISAAWSRRLDHTLAALGAAAAAADLTVDITDPGLAGWVLTAAVRPSIALGPRGAECSVFALLGPARVTLRGMRYGLSSELIQPLSDRGLSNVIESRVAEVLVEEGVVLALSCPDVGDEIAVPTSVG